jgi:radical SAM superfamily enzyme YgiQ (UPF0313 family)
VNAVLINPPNHRRDTDDLAPPLGLLCLFDALAAEGVSVALIDYNLYSITGALEDADHFYVNAARDILGHQPDFVCFTSMGINSHVALGLARELKKASPHIVTVFGGPHFSALAERLLKDFWFVDAVVIGEGESAVQQLVRTRQRSAKFPRKAWRSGPLEFSGHPWRAYRGLNLAEYFEANPLRVLNMETGRGCKYKCKFCYSPGFWTEPTDFPIRDVVSDFERAALIGASHLFVVQDNLLNDPDYVRDLCAELRRIPDRPSWNCYATLPDLRPQILGDLAGAGCNSIYVGIDAVTARQKAAFGKAFARTLDVCHEKINWIISAGITPTCSFIFDPIHWDAAELEENLRWALSLRQRGAELSFHVLTYYPNTGLTRQPKTESHILDDYRISLMFDCPEVVLCNPFALAYPNMFPFHVRPPCNGDEYRHAVTIVHVAQTILTEFPLEIAQLLSEEDLSISALVKIIAERVHKGNSVRVDALSAKVATFEACKDLLCKSYGFAHV